MEPARKARVDQLARIAVRLCAPINFPPQVLIAQWAIESQWGQKYVGTWNGFGIKRAKRHAMYTTVQTHEDLTPAQFERWKQEHTDRALRAVVEYEREGKLHVAIPDDFADYATLEEACADYLWTITHVSHYAAAWKSFQETGNVPDLISGIVKGGYATGHGYIDLAQQIAAQPSVLGAIEGAQA